METFFWYYDELEYEDPIEELSSNFGAMISAIIQWIPDPRLTPDCD